MDFAKALKAFFCEKSSFADQHGHPLYKLTYYGINNNALHLIIDFFYQRSPRAVVLEGDTSAADTILVTSGVASGTVQGHILFFLVI